MRPHSSRFLPAIYKTHRPIVQATVLTPAASKPLPVLDGSVTLEASADSRGRMDLTVPNSFAPTNGSSLLAPFGNEVQVWRGVEYAPGDHELIPLGKFRIESAEVSDAGADYTVQITGIDRSIRFIEEPFEEAFVVAAGQNVADYIAEIAKRYFPGCPMDFATVETETIEFNVNEGDTGWELMQVLALSANCGLWFDGEGILVLRPLPTGTAPAIATFAEGEALLSASRSMTRDNAMNRAVVTGESSSEESDVPYGEAIDDNLFSPTRYGGPFGRKTYTYVDSYGLHATDAACQRAADSLLREHLGITESVNFEAKVNPALEPYDVVELVRERLDIPGRYILDSVSIPLGGGSMSCSTRAAQVTSA